MFSTELSPVQVLFLQAPTKVGIDDMISSILRDLTLRRVLNVIKINSFPNDRSRKTQKYFMFVRGENYEGYEHAEYEKGFIKPFEEINQAQAKTLTNFLLKKYSTPSGFIKDKIYRPLNKDGFASSLPILKAFGYYKVTAKGKQIITEFNEFLKTQEEKLKSLIDGDREEFINVLNETGVYAFYFEKNNPELYKNLISMVKRINRSKPLGVENDLTNFMEAMNVDVSYFEE